MKYTKKDIPMLNEAYRKGEPLVSDAEYDSLVTSDEVIDTVEGSRKEKLPIKMMSADKVKTLEAVFKWFDKIGLKNSDLIDLSAKYDGISLCLQKSYSGAWTRGDGEYGQASWGHYEHCNSLVPHNVTSITYGEAIMPNEKFKKYVQTEDNPKGYKNPRNMVAGLFNRDRISEAIKDVDFVPYGIAGDDMRKSTMMDVLGTEHVTIPVCELTEELLDELYEDWSETYLIDGIIIDVDSAEKRAVLGREENGNPAYMRAVKLPQWGGEQETTVRDVIVEVSKDGVLSPVGICDPLIFDGVEVTRFSCYNAKYVWENSISAGAVIKLTRSGDVIPKHLETISVADNCGEKFVETFENCPSCGSQTQWDSTMTHKVCNNVECTGRKIKQIAYFFREFEFEDFGESKVRNLYGIGVTDISMYLEAITAPEETIKNISKLPGWGKSSASSLVNQLVAWHQKEKPLAKIMSALNLFYGKLGSSTAQLIFDERESVKKLTEIEGVGEISAKCFENALFNWNQNYKHLIPLFGNFYEKTPLVVATSDALEGEVICCTGCRLSGQEKDAVQLAGGIVKDGWSKAVTILIVKDNSPKVMGSGKAKKAIAAGKRVITISDFRNEVQ